MSTFILESECPVQGCSRTYVSVTASRCPVHTILRDARHLSPQDLAQVRREIADLIPMTDAEREAHLRRYRLAWLEDEVARKERSVQAARDAGASDAEIRRAVAAGQAKAVKA